MTAERMRPVFPVRDLGAAVDLLAAVLDRAPTFVDGGRWAQFDVGGGSLALAGTDRASEVPSLSVKVSVLDATVAGLRAEGHDIGDPVAGPHERRAVLRSGDDTAWEVVLYEPTG